MKWTVHLEGGPMRVNHAAVCVGDKIYSFGGYCSNDEYKDWQPIPVHILDPATLRWTQVKYTQEASEIPFERYGHSAVAYKEKIYLWGGRNNAVQCEILACFDVKTYEWTYPQVCGQVPYAKDGHTACLIGNRMYVFGGFEYHTDQYSDELHYLDMDTLEWHCIQAEGESPSHRDFHTAVAYGDKMYIFGGRGDLNSPYNSQEEDYCSQLFILETVGTHKWNHGNPGGPWPGTRRSHSAWVYKDYMYIFGGYNGLLHAHFNDVWRYSFKENVWSYRPLQGVPPSKRRRQQCIMYGTKMYLFGGTSPDPHVIFPITEEGQPNDAVMRKPETLIDNSDMHVLDFEPSLKTLAICRILELGHDTSSLPWDIKSRSMPLLADDLFPQSDDEVQVEKKRMDSKETKRTHASATVSEEQPRKRSRIPHSSKSKPVIKPITPVRVTSQDLFGDDTDGEMPGPSCADEVTIPTLQSVFINKLSSGLSKQVLPDKKGSHYVEIKVFKSDEVDKVLPINRWRHSVTSLKIRTDDNCEFWTHLANVIKAARKEFRGVPNHFSSNFSMQL